MSDRTDYYLPWRLTDNEREQVTDRDGDWVTVFQWNNTGTLSRDTAGRIVKVMNLLQHVPDAAPCFSEYKSDEVQLALAVLQGDFGAAAALADEVVAKYQRPEPLPSSKAVVGGAGVGNSREETQWRREFDRGSRTTRRAATVQRVYRVSHPDRWRLVWHAVNQTDPTPVWCDFDPRDPQGLNGAKKEVAAAFDRHHGLASPPSLPPVPTPEGRTTREYLVLVGYTEEQADQILRALHARNE